MDESVSGQMKSASSQAAVTIGGTGYAMGHATTGIIALKGKFRPEGGIIRLFHTLHVIGVESDSARKVTIQLAAVMGALYGALMLLSGVQAVFKARAAYLTLVAAAETTIKAATLQWHMIIMAVIGTAAVYVGLQLGSGAWKLPSVNLNNHHDSQKAVKAGMSQATGG